MKTYVVESGFPTNFYPPLTKDQLADLYDQHLFRPLREKAKESGGELVITEELNLIGRVIVEASEKAAKTLRSLGFRLQIKKSQ